MALSEEARARLDERAGEIIARYPRPRSALLPLMHLVQAEEGYVSDDGLGYCADRLGLTKADVAATVSYYTMFKRHPVGEYHVGVCTNTLCAVLGGDQILATLREHLGVGDNEPTPDGKVSVEHVECNAGCDFAPVVMVNWEFFDNMTPDSARKLVDDLRAGVTVTPSRGPGHLCTWREAAEILAGYPDGQAGDGAQAAGPSLAGLRLAQQRGWRAPAQAAEAARAPGAAGARAERAAEGQR
jgi:NADH-quinone oxidoreductase subunit E